MEEMEYPEMLSRTADHKEIADLLEGYNRKVFQPSQYAGGDPVDAGRILSKVVYPAYKINSHVKEEIEQVLYEMLSRTDYDVYIVVLYVMSELFKEKHSLAPFKMDMAKILSRLKEELNCRQKSIQKGVRYPNGYTRICAWDILIRFKKVCKNEYDVTLF